MQAPKDIKINNILNCKLCEAVQLKANYPPNIADRVCLEQKCSGYYEYYCENCSTTSSHSDHFPTEVEEVVKEKLDEWYDTVIKFGAAKDEVIKDLEKN